MNQQSLYQRNQNYQNITLNSDRSFYDTSASFYSPARNIGSPGIQTKEPLKTNNSNESEFSRIRNKLTILEEIFNANVLVNPQENNNSNEQGMPVLNPKQIKLRRMLHGNSGSLINEKKSELESALNIKSKAAEHWKSRSSVLTDRLKVIEKENERMKIEIQSLKTENVGLKESNEKEVVLIENIENEKNETIKETEFFRKKFMETEIKYEELKFEHQCIKENSNNQEKELNKLKRTIEILEDTLKLEKGKIIFLETKISDNNQNTIDLESIQTEINKLKIELKKAKCKLIDRDEEIEELKEQQEEIKKEYENKFLEILLEKEEE